MKQVMFTVTVSLAAFFGSLTPLVGASERQYILYSEFGAVGDGVTDDFDAIIKAHAAANEAGLPVRADAGATYYIGAANKTAQIQTDTDWGDAKFIIDDSKLEAPKVDVRNVFNLDDSNVDVRKGNNHVFHISSQLPAIPITTVSTLKKNQAKLDLSLQYDSFIIVLDSQTMRYIRNGANPDHTRAQQNDLFVVDKNGNVDKMTPIIWDFDNISSMMAYPIDPKMLTVKGGHFTSIANQAESKYTYYVRGIGITRSNVVIDGVHHVVAGELDHGAPYWGFIDVSYCTNVMVQNSVFSGRKTYVTTGATGGGGSHMGSYDLIVTRANNVTFKNCKQANDIHDTKYWGIFGSNFSKNITFDTVEFSRFDAHAGVTNATIKNSVLGHQGINLIGHGLFLLENTKVCGWFLINLREDYGGMFNGEVIIRNCEFVPRNRTDAVLIEGRYSGQGNFGYVCSMPRKITIDGLVINDSNLPENYLGPKIFASFNRAFTSAEYVEKYPYVITEEVEISNLTIKSGKPLIISNNPFMFRNVKITER